MMYSIDYQVFFQQMLGQSGPLPRAIPLSSLSSLSVQKELKAAGIDTNSRQYKAVINSMMNTAGGAAGYTNVQAIKNRMSHYDKDGDWIDPVSGLSGLLVTEQNLASKNRIIPIPESSREEMFQSTKRDFLMENGVHNGDTTHRSEVFQHLYRKMPKNDRLAAGHTLEQYERQYWLAFVDAAKAADPDWESGKCPAPGALDHVTRETVESRLVQSGSRLVKKTLDVSV